jgi:hypothetical protein
MSLVKRRTNVGAPRKKGLVMKTKLYILGSVMAFGMLAATNANASYMSKCNKLIAAEAACKETGQSCAAETTAIAEQCKCHVPKGDDWKLVTAAVGKDGVCNATFPYDDVPPPGDPRPSHGNLGKGSPDIDGNDTRDRGGPEEGNKGHGNKK